MPRSRLRLELACRGYVILDNPSGFGYLVSVENRNPIDEAFKILHADMDATCPAALIERGRRMWRVLGLTNTDLAAIETCIGAPKLEQLLSLASCDAPMVQAVTRLAREFSHMSLRAFSRSWRTSKKGGLVRSPRKAAAARANGKLGGRPALSKTRKRKPRARE